MMIKLQIGGRVKIKDRTSVLFSALGIVKAFQPADRPWRGEKVLVATDDGLKGLFSPEVLRAA